MGRFVFLFGWFTLMAMLEPIVDRSALSDLNLALIVLFPAFCLGCRLIAGKWPEFN